MTAWQLFTLFIKIGMSFGAGTGMSAVLQEELVNRRKSIERGEFMTLYGLARIVPAGTITALAVAIGYRYGRLPGSLIAVLAMILPAFAITLALTVVYTLLAGSAAFRVINVTLMPAALAVVIVSSLRLGQEFFSVSVELALAILAFASVFLLGVNPSLLLIVGGLIGAVAIRRRA